MLAAKHCKKRALVGSHRSFSYKALLSRKIHFATIAASSEDHGTQPDFTALTVLWNVLYDWKFSLKELNKNLFSLQEKILVSR